MKVPKLRFKSYTDDWEQRKVLDIAPLQRGFDLPTAEMKPGKYPVVMSNGIGGFHSEYKAKGPGVITGRSGTIGKLHYVESDYWPHNTSLWVTDFKGNSPKFIYHLYDWLDLSRFGTGSGVPTLNRNDVHDTKVAIPGHDEQQKIADYLDGLDSLITLHQRKCYALKELKNGMLQKMFPKEGAKVPEFRFKGFTGDWEQRKLGDISTKVTTKNAGANYTETLTNSAEHGIISQRDYFDHDVSNMENISAYYIVEDNDFVYNPRISTSAPVGPINRNKLGRTGVMSPLYTVFKTHDVDESYLEWFFKSSYWHKFMYFNGDTGARSDRFAIKDAVFFDMPIPTPKIEEQRKVGIFLTELDNHITLHQCKSDALRELKKGVLQRMFA